MKYQYGNGSNFEYEQNYLEFLRVALDFSVEVLQSETAISELREQILEAEKNAEVEKAQVDALLKSVSHLLDGATDDHSKDVVVSLRDQMKAACDSETQRALGTIDATLRNFISRSNDNIASQRAANVQRLETVLQSCDLPATEKRYEIVMDGSGTYVGTLECVASNLVHTEMQLTIPKGNLFSEAIRVDSVLPDLQINLPDAGGFLKRANKIVPQKLSKEYVTSMSVTTDGVLISLRNAPREGQAGFNLLFGETDVKVIRVSRQLELSEPFTVESQDREHLLKLYRRLHDAAEAVAWSRHRITTARIDNEPLAAYAEPDQLVLWLLEHLIPVVQNIARNTLAPNELVLKRILGDDKREELFLSKVEMANKLKPLTSQHKAFFAPLGLDKKNQDMKNLPAPTKSNIVIPQTHAAAPTVPLIVPPEPDAEIPDEPEKLSSSAASLKSQPKKNATASKPSESKKDSEESVIVESEKSLDLALPDEQTSELDLTELDDDEATEDTPASRSKSEAPTTRVQTSVSGKPSVASDRGSIPPIKPSNLPLGRQSATPPPPPRPSSTGTPVRPSLLPDGSKPSQPPLPKPQRDSLSPMSRDALEKRIGNDEKTKDRE